jgi:hypothetical protein
MALSKAGFILGIRAVDSLFPHEQVIPSHVQKISSEIMQDGVQKDPIIIDGDSSTVLDGMHRLAAFKELRIERAVTCAVPYRSDSVVLKRWVRTYTPSGASSPLELLEAMGPTRRITLAEAFSALESKDVGVAAMVSDTAYVPEGSAGLRAAIELVAEIDRFAEARSWERKFIPEDEVDEPLQDKKKIIVLMKRLTKEDIVGAARTGALFPCKSSMHVIDPRPVGVDFPVGDLNKATSGSLEKLLEGRGGRVLPVNSVYGGRRYKERLLLLSQS